MDTTHDRHDLQRRIADTLEPLIRQAIADFGVPGLAVGLVKNDELIYARGFGVRDVRTREPVTPQSLFHMASISKPFVATAVMQLAQAGTLELDASVRTYVPYFRPTGDGAETITIRQLLTHTAGLADAMDYGWSSPEHDDAALERYVRSLDGKPLIGKPGASVQYSNDGFELLGHVVAKVSGLSFEDYLKTNVLDPLGMHTSTFLPSEVAPELATTPHLGLPSAVVEGVYPYNRAHAPSSTLHSSVLEMSRWARANLGNGELDGQQILRPQSHAEMWRPQAETGDEGWAEAAALGWFVGTYRGHRVVAHDGGDAGFETNLVLLPDDNIALVLLTNCNTAPINAITYAALDVLLGLEPVAPKPPVALAVATALAGEGHDAAVALYRELIERPDDYDGRPWRFANAIEGAIEVHQPGAVWPLLELWAELQPDEPGVPYMLGWAHFVTGDFERAAPSLRRALELDDENEHAAQLLECLTS